MSAVSTNVPPTSRKRSTIASDASSSASRPNVIVPRQSRETTTPDLPRVTYSMGASSVRQRAAAVGIEQLDLARVERKLDRGIRRRLARGIQPCHDLLPVARRRQPLHAGILGAVREPLG